MPLKTRERRPEKVSSSYTSRLKRKVRGGSNRSRPHSSSEVVAGRRQRSGIHQAKRVASARNPRNQSNQKKYECKFHHFETVDSAEWRHHPNIVSHRHMTVMYEDNIFYMVRTRDIKY